DHPCDATAPEGGKYVECSIWLMLKWFLAHGVASSDIEAKLFGGSDMFDTTDGRNPSVGSQNMQKAVEVLEAESIRVLSSDTGGARGRKIFFYPHTGEVLLKRLRKTET